MIDVSDQELFALVNCSSCGAGMRVRRDFANFEIQGVLGEGGQGIVYRAVDKKLDRPVAIKVMKRQYSADPDFVRRFESEARITASLNDPHIVKVFSSGESQGLLYLAMEIVDHGSLDSLMATLKKLPEAQVIDIGIQIATGLKAGLKLGLIHRDIKPGNILFADAQTAKIVDFGLAILVEKQHEEEGDVWATPYYVAPEKLDGQPEDFRSDMYSLAATLFHALAGRPPFISESNSMADLRRIKSQPVHLENFAPRVSKLTALAIDRALSFKPQDRFGSYREFIERLEFARSELGKNPVNPSAPRVLMTGDRITGGSWATFITVACVVAVGLYLWTHRSRPVANKMPEPGAETATGDSDLTADKRFDLGRKQLVEQRFSDAAKIFRALYDEGRLQEPKNSWAAVHCGLAELFAGKPGPARVAFKTLAEHATPTVIGLDAKLVAFFKQLVVLASRKAKDGQPDFDEFNANTYESLAYLVAGLKQLDDGDFEGATEALIRFQKASPTGEDGWVADYHPLVTCFLDDLTIFNGIATDIAKADTVPKIAGDALRKIPAARGKMHSVRLRKELGILETEGAQKVEAALAAAENAMKQQQAAAEAREEKLLTGTKLQVKNLCENFHFSEAASLIRAVDVKIDRNISDRDLVAKRVDWLVEFKQRLIEDINVGGCAVPLLKRNGQKILGTVSRADDKQLERRVQFGSLPAVKWEEISSVSVLQMARAFMRPTQSQAEIADREWRAAVFCLFAGLFNEGQALMDNAAARKPDYQNDRALFFGQPAPSSDPAPEPGAPPAPDALPATGIEMADQPLNPSSKPKGAPPPDGVPDPQPQ